MSHIIESRKAAQPLAGDLRTGSKRHLQLARTLGLSVGLGFAVLAGMAQAAGPVPAGLDAASWASLQAQLTQEAKLTASNGVTGDGFGGAVAVDGDTAVIGASNKTVSGNLQQGEAYVYVRNGTKWRQQAKLFVSGNESDQFGGAVAVSGETLIIGAPRAAANASNPFGTRLGAAYIYVREGGLNGSWSQQARLTADDGQDGDFFGRSVAVFGNTALIGASEDDGSRGSAYVFTRSGSQWSVEARLTADDGASGDNFGGAVSLSADTALIGSLDAAVAGQSKQGAAYVFVRAAGFWTQQARLTADGGVAFDNFGIAVGMDGETAVVGARFHTIGGNGSQGAAYVFARNAGIWSQQAELTASDGAANDQFGFAVAVSGDTILAGALAHSVDAKPAQGAAYIFGRSGDAWTQQAQPIAADGNENDLFGISVALSGTTAIAGAPQADSGSTASAGASYVYRIDGAASQALLSIADASIVEGNDGKHNLRFTVTLNPPSAFGVAVTVTTADDSATSGSDYSYRTRRLSFAPGQTSATFKVPVLGDINVESDETFFVNLSEPTFYGVIGDGQAVGTIRNDD